MENTKSEFTEAVTEMSRLAGALAGAAVVAGKRIISYVDELTSAETNLKYSAEDDSGDRKTKASTD